MFVEHLHRICKVAKDRIGSRQTFILTFSYPSAVVTIRVILDDRTGADIVITNMSVLPESRRRMGYGQTAIRTLLKAARENELENGDIRAVQVQEDSEGFWKKMGFVSTRNYTNDFIYKGAEN